MNLYKQPGIMISFKTILLFVIVSFAAINSMAQENIKNDSFSTTIEGKPINSQGGGIFKFTDPSTGSWKYYWYGVHYTEADLYRQNHSVTYPNATFESVTCYSSTDLVNWKSEGDVLSKSETNQAGKTWVGRLGVAYLSAIQKYALFVQHGNQVLVTTSDTPTGQFKWHQRINMEPIIGTSNTGDQTVFTDEDTQKSYLVYSYGRGRNKIYLSEIGIKDGKIGLLDCNQIFHGESREGNCMFKYNGKYYMYASNIYGWDGSLAYYLVADDIKGPYLPANKMLVTPGSEEDYAHVSQTGFFVNVKGTEQETVIFCGDRWANFAGNGLGYNQWCPLSFEQEKPYFNSLNSWNLDAKTGKWSVARDNNFVKNGSFEADRRSIPSEVKPLQLVLTGWTTRIITGNKVSLDSTTSPRLNHFNTTEERKIVVGEKSLNISDRIDFQRQISQKITSGKEVKLTDGLYKLTAHIKNTKGFSTLKMYAISAGKTFEKRIAEENKEWKTIILPNIKVIGGKVEIGFITTGKANSACIIDDVSFTEVEK